MPLGTKSRFRFLIIVRFDLVIRIVAKFCPSVTDVTITSRASNFWAAALASSIVVTLNPVSHDNSKAFGMQIVASGSNSSRIALATDSGT